MHPVSRPRPVLPACGSGGILVRHFDQPPVDNYLRVTVGTDGEMEAFHDRSRGADGGSRKEGRLETDAL